MWMAIEFHMIFHTNLTCKFPVNGHSHFTHISPVALENVQQMQYKFQKKIKKERFKNRSSYSRIV